MSTLNQVSFSCEAEREDSQYSANRITESIKSRIEDILAKKQLNKDFKDV